MFDFVAGTLGGEKHVISVVNVDQGLLQIGSDDDLFDEIMGGVAASGQPASPACGQAVIAGSVKAGSVKTASFTDLRVDDGDAIEFLSEQTNVKD
jgi:hypothetical protein